MHIKSPPFMRSENSDNADYKSHGLLKLQSPFRVPFVIALSNGKTLNSF